ncbi:MAG: tRNA (adenosine(37)-N6)-dimethylallyltransferase MiaA, partial [Patescibacteria group bacterium]|nr:tRNA (adenosine(37)-N6)-dimethylallyltransferase MiaA [Patescibacteria group bacterium]
RVGKRLKVGFEKEMDMLVKQGFNSGLQSAYAIGYAQWLKFLNKEISKEQAIKEWIHKEQFYAKRQMTWFRKDKRIHWFYVDNYGFFAEVADLVIKWHNKA